MLGGVVGSIGNFKVWPSRAAAAVSAFGLAVAISALACAPALAQPPYEPNDSLLTGYGPLANNTTYTAADETENDTDFYYFYVTTPSTAQLTFTLTNLGGPAKYENIVGYVTDSHGGEITTIGGPEPADYATKSVSLQAGKYYVEIYGSDGYGDSYKFTTGGTDGAFGAYSTIQSNCATATVPVSTYQAQLAVAQANLKKAEARLRRVRSHRSTRRARRRAAAKVRHVRETIDAEEESLKAAEAGQKPWCFIPQ
ncbi:MAG: PPC domain-containing protein [Solirubrobacterales bacterium]